MLNKIFDFSTNILHSKDFACDFSERSSADDISIKQLENALRNLECNSLDSLLEFYRLYDGFNLSWRLRKSTHDDYLTWGNTRIVELKILLSTIQIASLEPILFDYISDVNQVMMQIKDNQIKLLYYDEYKQEDLPLSIGVNEYFHLLDESRGLYPWQEFFVDSASFQMKQELRDKFFVDLNLLFQDSNSTIFT